MTETLPEQLEAQESMFVQTAQGIDSDGGTLTLRGTTPSTLYFSDRPKRVVGHMATVCGVRRRERRRSRRRGF
jgi:hypothetical protein